MAVIRRCRSGDIAAAVVIVVAIHCCSIAATITNGDEGIVVSNTRHGGASSLTSTAVVGMVVISGCSCGWCWGGGHCTGVSATVAAVELSIVAITMVTLALPLGIHCTSCMNSWPPPVYYGYLLMYFTC